MFYYKSDLSISLALKDENGDAVSGATVLAYLFKEIPLHLNTGPAAAAVQNVKPNTGVISTLAFTEGVTVEAGNKIEQVGDAASALVTKVSIESGSFAAGDAAGTLELANQSGDFASGTIRVGQTTNEKQTLTNSGATGGTFQLTFRGQTTANINFNAQAGDVESALENLSTLTAVTCTGGPLDTTPVVVEFLGAATATDLIGRDVELLVSDNSGLTDGGGQEIVITETVKGTGYVATIAGNSDEGGTFTLSFDNETTTAIKGNASLADIKSALDDLPNMGTVTVTGAPLDTSPVSNGFYVTWTDAEGKVPLLSIDISSLKGPSTVATSKTTEGHLLGAALEDVDGKVGLPVEEHTVTVYQFIWVLGTRNHDGFHDILDVGRDKIVADKAFVAEEFTGEEEVFVGLEGGKGLSLTEVGSTGTYKGSLPDDLKRYLRGKRHLLVVEAVSGATRLIIAEAAVVGFYTGT